MGWYSETDEHKETSKKLNQNIMRVIENRRVEKGISIRMFSELIGVSYQTYRNMLRGTSSFSAAKLYQVAEVLGMDVNELYGGTRTEEKR